MNNNDEKIPVKDKEKLIRKPYIKPLLEALGDLRTLTLGGSPFQTGDMSGDPDFTGPFA
jgi:hypothetical protein